MTDEDEIIANHDLSPNYVECNHNMMDEETLVAIQSELEFDEGDGTQETDNLLGFNQSGLSPEVEGASVLASARVPHYVPKFCNTILPTFLDIKSYLSDVINPRISLSNQYEGTDLFRACDIPLDLKVLINFYYW